MISSLSLYQSINTTTAEKRRKGRGGEGEKGRVGGEGEKGKIKMGRVGGDDVKSKNE